MFDDLWWIWLILGISVLILIVITIVDYRKRKQNHEKNVNFIDIFNTIKIGDSESETMTKLGSNCTKSFLKDGTEKCEWRIRVQGSSSSFYNQGAGVTNHTNGYVIRMTIKFQNGVVVEKLSNNTDFGKSSANAISNYDLINIGMSKSEAINLLGGGYSISILKNGEEKYTWKIRVGSTTHSYRWFKGYSTRDYTGSVTKRVTLVFKNNSVIEKTAANL